MKELIAVLYGIRSLKEKLKGKKICIRVDNKVVMSYLNRMTGRIRHLAEIVRVIHLEVMEIGSSLHTIYIANKENDVANAISRTKEYHNWEVLESDFQKLEKKWGPHIIDRLADHRNSKLGRFNS
jgi:hypothetical protein